MNDDIELDEDRLDAGETKAAKTARRTAKQKAADLDAAYRETMATIPGRKMLWDILANLGINQTPLVPGARDLTYCAIGRQNAGIELMVRLCALSPDLYLQMQKENSL